MLFCGFILVGSFSFTFVGAAIVGSVGVFGFFPTGGLAGVSGGLFGGVEFGFGGGVLGGAGREEGRGATLG